MDVSVAMSFISHAFPGAPLHLRNKAMTDV